MGVNWRANARKALYYAILRYTNMPVYEYQCPEGHVTNELRTVADRERAPECYCGHMTQKVILHAPRVFGDYEGYESPTSGKWIEGRRARLEDLKRTNCRPYEDGERAEFERRRATADRELDKTVDEVVDRSMEVLTQHDEGSDARQQLMRG
jgi:putative FmdB family regulatory protein